MCRHLAYLGPPRTIRSLVLDPPHSLRHQAEAPRLQHAGATNLDGWGVAWWPAPGDPPQDHRTVTPLPADHAFADAEATAVALLAAARLASPGSVVAVDGNAPFAAAPWRFSLNGFVAGFHDGVGTALRQRLSPARREGLQGDTDSEVLFGLALDAMDAGAGPGHALQSVLAAVLSVSEGRLNLLISDGRAIWATAYRHSLFTLADAGLAAGGVLVASEPLDDDPSWADVPDGSLVEATAHDLRITPLAGIEGAA